MQSIKLCNTYLGRIYSVGMCDTSTPATVAHLVSVLFIPVSSLNKKMFFPETFCPSIIIIRDELKDQQHSTRYSMTL